MVNNAELLRRRRHAVRVFLRLGQVTCLTAFVTAGLGRLIQMLVFQSAYGTGTRGVSPWSAVMQQWWSPFAQNIWLLVLVLLLLGIERGVLRWIVPAIGSGCPGCGYETRGAARCPECGLRLAAEPTPPPPA